MGREVVTVYVRLGPGENDRERQITFDRPEGIPDKEWLDRRWAIDGNQVMFIVSGNEMGLDDALVNAETQLQKLLGEHGFDVEFE